MSTATTPDKTQQGVIYFSGGPHDGALSPEGKPILAVPVPRTFHFQTNVENAALYSLMEGPTQSEQRQGYYYSFAGLRVENSNVNDATRRMYVELVSIDPHNPWAPAGLGPIFMDAQIGQTLRQFNTIDDYIVLIDGVNLNDYLNDGQA